MEDLASRYSNAKVFSLGNSYERRPIKAIKVRVHGCFKCYYFSTYILYLSRLVDLSGFKLQMFHAFCHHWETLPCLRYFLC